LRFFGNYVKQSKPIVVFNQDFDEKPHLSVFKYLITDIFSSNYEGGSSESILDHVMSFVYYNSRIWLRVYQIKYLKNLPNIRKKFILLEIGPRITCLLSKAWSNYLKNEIIFDFSNII
jgi:ribosome biogenesis protein BRX1